MLLDVDNFKGYNDTFGHLEGDKALKVLATVTRKALRRTDAAFRYGGEEFMIILPETRGENAMEVAERIRKNFENSIFSSPSQLKAQMTVSIGVTGYISPEEITTFLKRADSAMNEAKKKGKNCIHLAA
jgi:diguanylate cyclase (GGDEF)-like protein